MPARTTQRDVYYFKEHFRESVERIFAAVSDLHAKYWNAFFRFAIFENDEESWESMLQKIHRRYLDAWKSPGPSAPWGSAAAAAGVPASGRSIPEEIVFGIDLPGAQLSHAKRFDRSNLRFKSHDIMHVERFDRNV